MILPRTSIVHENLRTAFVDLNNFLQSLKEDNFTGYVQLSFWDYEGILFLEAGEIVNAFEESQGKKRGGEDAVESIMRMSKQRDGRINVYRLSPEMVTILASTSMNEPAYKDLSTEFTSLDKLIDKLNKENHTGYIDIALNEGKGGGIIVFQDGKVVEAILFDERSSEIIGREMLDKIIQDVQKRGATFNVYRAGFELDSSDRLGKGLKKPIDLEGAVEVVQEILRAVESVFDGVTKRKGSFRETFTQAQLTKLDEYPFLDPFAAEFEYRDGEVKLRGKVSVDDFVNGVRDCIEVTLDKIPVVVAKEELYNRIRGALEPVRPRIAEKIEGLGLKSTMSQLFTP